MAEEVKNEAELRFLVGVGALLLYFGTREAASVHLITPPQTTEALKENVEWLKKQAASVES